MSRGGLRSSSFRLAGMDCAAEESLVRMALDELPAVRSLAVDLEGRRVDVVHEGGSEAIAERLAGLSLGLQALGSRSLDAAAAEHGSGPVDPAQDAGAQGRLLWTVLAINAGFFALEAAAGWLARSMGLLGDSLDMLADALVYGMALVAVGRSAALKRRIAGVSGVLQLALAALGFVEVLRRALAATAPPDVATMILVAALALAGNVATLRLLTRARSGEAHLRASVIFTSNDVIVNVGVIAAGALVALSGSRWPDLAIGAVVFGLVARGALRILTLARPPASHRERV